MRSSPSALPYSILSPASILTLATTAGGAEWPRTFVIKVLQSVASGWSTSLASIFTFATAVGGAEWPCSLGIKVLNEQEKVSEERRCRHVAMHILNDSQGVGDRVIVRHVQLQAKSLIVGQVPKFACFWQSKPT
jgi:hypothetical protein